MADNLFVSYLAMMGNKLPILQVGELMIDRLIEILLSERSDGAPFGSDNLPKEDLFRALCNVRPPNKVTKEFLDLQDAYLQQKTEERGIVDVNDFAFKNAMSLWQGDITRLKCDAIVNACNSALLGCFHPLHNCIDNIIHSNAGIQVRLDCNDIMQGSQLPNGHVVITSAYNLPSQTIFHTVGPIVNNRQPTEENQSDLATCYRCCLDQVKKENIQTIAFCCLSTGVYGYPKQEAAKCAVSTVRNWLAHHNDVKVIFNVFTDEDKAYYEQELSK